MHWTDRDLLYRARMRLIELKHRLFGEPSEEVYRARLTEALRSVRGMEIEDVYPAGSTTRDEVHR